MATENDSAMPSEPIPPRLAGEVPQFVIGRDYKRREDIHLKYGGSWQNGISSSAVCPAIFLFTGESGEQFGYRDGFDSENVFSYTGQGQVGDMEFKSGNRSIRDHARDGRALYLFQILEKESLQRYMGEFVLANYSIRRAPDRNQNKRDVIVFHLLRVDDAQDSPTQSDPYVRSLTLAEARQKALDACSGVAGAAGAQAVRTVYERSRAIRDYVRLRAKGICEACDAAAPFVGIDGLPYLEAHHTRRLSDGGIDHPRNVAAICPACHREVHFGQSGDALNKRVIERLALREP